MRPWRSCAPGAPTRACTPQDRSPTLTPLPSASVRSWVLGANSRTAGGRQPRLGAARAGSLPRALQRRGAHLPLRHPEPRRALGAATRSAPAWVHRALDVERMAEAARVLVGEHDFSAFRAAECQAKSPVRRLEQPERRARAATGSSSRPPPTPSCTTWCATSPGSSSRVGAGDAAPAWAHEVLEGRDRTPGRATAPAAGLYLVRVRYPPAFGLPVPPLHEASSPDRL